MNSCLPFLFCIFVLCIISLFHGSLLYHRLNLSRPSEFPGSNYGNSVQSAPIPVPTQIHNYQRMEQNLQFPSQEESPR